MDSTITIKKGASSKKFVVEIDADRFEQLAANLGFFSKGFLASLARAEKDEKEGKTKKINSLKEIKA